MGVKHMFHSMGRGLAAILFLIMVSSLVLSFLLRFTGVTESSLKWVTLGLSFLALFAGGFISGKKGQSKGWLLGGGTSLLFSFLVFLIQYLGYQSTFNSTQYMYHGIFLALSMLGGIMGVNLSSHNNAYK
ncbi:TIGR04086 family membrane protein [Bacillus sp. NEB1478]|uniref:TIGR04086 family membrane protein n=1 Tax=Bacillus sp. NEB1478 TaxID=3073816 RepID=UPI00287395F8|nr:TIGR04086 family membrane protein [Bacillus sp. NEB1478]WNB93293.1 TIGR04086 family membrane protein [Bacillus sp. NEB1478]